MIKYEDLTKGAFFNIAFHELKPLNNNSELKQKYSLRYFQTAVKKALAFVKDSDSTCHELTTKEEFVLDGNKMINEKTGLYFFASYVDTNSAKFYEDTKVVREYFEDAEYYNNNDIKMSLSR
jgi:hypothetical protein